LAHKVVLISVLLALQSDQLKLQDQGYRASSLRGMPNYRIYSRISRSRV